MLKLAYSYREKVNKQFEKIAFNERYKFFSLGWWNYEMEISNNSWNNIQMVSVDADNNIIGFFSADIIRHCNKACCIQVINFCEEVNIIFSKDLYQFLDELMTKHNLRKIEWTVVIGNPAEKIYDKIIKKYNGRVIGIRKESVTTPDGVFRDEKEYEIFKDDYIKAKNKKQTKEVAIVNYKRDSMGWHQIFRT